MNKHYLIKELKKKHMYSFYNESEIDLYMNYSLFKGNHTIYHPPQSSIFDLFVDLAKGIMKCSIKITQKTLKIFKHA